MSPFPLRIQAFSLFLFLSQAAGQRLDFIFFRMWAKKIEEEDEQVKKRGRRAGFFDPCACFRFLSPPPLSAKLTFLSSPSYLIAHFYHSETTDQKTNEHQRESKRKSAFDPFDRHFGTHPR